MTTRPCRLCQNPRPAREEALQAFSSLLKHTPDALVIACPDGIICAANALAEALFGYEPETLEGTALKTLIPRRFQERHRRHFQAYFEAPRKREMGERSGLFGRHKSGEEIPLEISLSPATMRGEVISIAFLRDISLRKTAEDAMQRLNAVLEEKVRQRTKALEAANKDLSAFCYSVSHELRAPLTGISGFSQVLYEDYAERLDRQGLEYLSRIIEGSRHMETLIEGLLSLFRVGQEALYRDRVDLGDLAEHIISELRARQPDRPMSWRKKGVFLVDGDAGLLRQALKALLENAWKYTGKQAEPRIEFGVLDSKSPATFYLRDNGCGFDMNYAQKLFTPFQRLHGKGEFPGNGIGLATVKRIIERHGGSIWGEGEPGQGATFYFRLPTLEDGRGAV